MCKIVIIGADGQLGSEFVSFFDKPISLTHKSIEISDYKSCCDVLSSISPDIVINTAAFHNVDLCESDKKKAESINVRGAYNLATLSEKLKYTLVHVSTSYIFDGDKIGLYTEEDIPNPINWYGHTKLLGEKAIKNNTETYYIIRTVALYGKYKCKAKNGFNFVTNMLHKKNNNENISVVCNEFISPTYTKDFVLTTKNLLDNYDYGAYNIVNTGSCSWYDFACEILKTKVEKKYRDINSIRPKNSSLKNKLYVRDWISALNDYMKETNL